MPNPMSVIDKLQQMLDVSVNMETKDRDDYVDVPYVDDDEYRTHRAFGEEEELSEQEEDEEEAVAEAPPEGEEAAVPEEEAAATEEVPADEAPEGDVPPDAAVTGGEEVPGADVGGLGGDLGMPGAEEPLTKKQIGRVYELKKIYTRLSSLEKHLADISDEEMVVLKNHVSNSVDLFKTISANFQQYKDDLDSIIVMFYKFLDTAYKMLRSFYKKNKGQED